MEVQEALRTEEIAESLLTVIEKARVRLLAKIRRKRKKLVKFVKELGEDFGVLTQKWSTTFVTATAALSIFLTSALPVTYASIPLVSSEITTLTFSEKENLRQKILDYLERVGKKGKANSQLLADLVGKISGLPVKVTLDGNQLPSVSGEIATEKHLKIYPGQTLKEHLKNPQDFEKFSWTGISNLPSAWGYFTQDRNLVTNEQVLKEKYYLVMQTFAAVNWNRDWPTLKEWYKYRKFLVYNPENGKAVVGVLADAGPAQYTGRAFGGSPEVMDALGLSETKTQGDVLVFFLDDPVNLISLGPVSGTEALTAAGVQNQ